MIRLQQTNNYDKFELFEINRNADGVQKMMVSMRKHGYIPAYPLHTLKGENGKLVIKGGHNRFAAASELKIPVFYVVCEDEATIHELERASDRWTVSDYLVSFVRNGSPDYVAIHEYHVKTGISIMNTVALMSGSSSPSNKMENFKAGHFEVKTMYYANIVADIVLHVRKYNESLSTNSYFTHALSRVAFVKGFDPKILKQKISSFPFLLQRQAGVAGYTKMIDEIYNRRSKVRVPLEFMAIEEARNRCAVRREEEAK